MDIPHGIADDQSILMFNLQFLLGEQTNPAPV